MIDISQTILIAAKKGFDGWMQLLIPLVFVAVYILSGIAKMRANKREEEKNAGSGQQQPQRRYKPLDDTSTRQRATSPYAKPPQRQQTRPQPQPQIRQAMPTHKEDLSQLRQPKTAQQILRERQALKAPHPHPQHVAKIQKKLYTPQPRAIDRKPHPPAKKTPVQAPLPVQQQPSLANLTQTGNLRMAIIYSEILGKPLALREML